MKKSSSLIVTRWVVGILFIFSGLVKANDPSGLSYKMQEFFEAWGWDGLNNYTLALSVIMNTFEVLAGVAVIIGWRMRLFSWLLLLLILFFCFLTAYAYLSGKIRTCGCFGDCLPLTPLTSFIKDVFLLILILLFFANRKHIHTNLASPVPQVLLLVSVLGTVYMQYYALKHLPFRDCLPYKKGNNILDQMKVPAGAIPDSFAVTFKYKKSGKNVEFDANNFPADFDSTYEFVDRFQKLVKAGSDGPAIVDFSLQTLEGNDTTSAILEQQNDYVTLWVNDFAGYADWKDGFDKLIADMAAKNIPVFLITSAKDKATELYGNNKQLSILLCDGTVIKTAARVNPTYIIMHGATVKDKFSYLDIDKLNSSASALSGR